MRHGLRLWKVERLRQVAAFAAFCVKGRVVVASGKWEVVRAIADPTCGLSS
jgi:hypothetical protein